MQREAAEKAQQGLAAAAGAEAETALQFEVLKKEHVRELNAVAAAAQGAVRRQQELMACAQEEHAAALRQRGQQLVRPKSSVLC